MYRLGRLVCQTNTERSLCSPDEGSSCDRKTRRIAVWSEQARRSRKRNWSSICIVQLIMGIGTYRGSKSTHKRNADAVPNVPSNACLLRWCNRPAQQTVRYPSHAIVHWSCTTCIRLPQVAAISTRARSSEILSRLRHKLSLLAVDRLLHGKGRILTRHSSRKRSFDLSAERKFADFVTLVATHGVSLLVQSLVLHSLQCARPRVNVGKFGLAVGHCGVGGWC